VKKLLTPILLIVGIFAGSFGASKILNMLKMVMAKMAKAKMTRQRIRRKIARGRRKNQATDQMGTAIRGSHLLNSVVSSLSRLCRTVK